MNSEANSQCGGHITTEKDSYYSSSEGEEHYILTGDIDLLLRTKTHLIS